LLDSLDIEMMKCDVTAGVRAVPVDLRDCYHKHRPVFGDRRPN